MKKNTSNFIIAIIFLAGVGLLLLPFIQNLYNGSKHAEVISNYKTVVNKISEKKMAKERNKAKEYNANLLGKVTLTDPFDESIIWGNTDEYESIMNVDGDGVMGILRIPIINVQLPIYHGTSSIILEKGVGHLEGTSFPIGGQSTHTVLSGHTGYPKAVFLDDLVDMKKGDLFYIQVFDKTLAYKVDQIMTVLPSNTGPLHIIQGEDHATLVTCTPYGINSHRLLVRGVRTKYDAGKDIVDKNRLNGDKRIYIYIALVCAGLILTVVFFRKKRVISH